MNALTISDVWDALRCRYAPQVWWRQPTYNAPSGFIAALCLNGQRPDSDSSIWPPARTEQEALARLLEKHRDGAFKQYEE